MRTGCYRNFSDKIAGAICISRSAPKNTRYPVYDALKPDPAWFRSAGIQEYIPLYNAILSKLDPQQVWDEVHELAKQDAIKRHGYSEADAAKVKPIILCWEAPGRTDAAFCHRRLAANWLSDALGVPVPEINKVGVPIPTWDSAHAYDADGTVIKIEEQATLF